MGNQSSQYELPALEEGSLHERIDYIATNYILTMDFHSLQKMYDKEYCDKLVLITSDIFRSYFTDLEIEKVSKLKLGDSVLFVNKHDLQHSNESEKEKRLLICRQISVFYVKIAHLFAAIVMTINPEYVYTNNSGKLVKHNLYDKKKIPKNKNAKLVKMNICDERIDLLRRAELEKENPFCYFNSTTLEDEPGIPELMQLYLDDNFDYKTGQFLEMSQEAKEQFLKDLRLFYTEFTGEPEMPETITKFGDIKLRNYGKNLKTCKKGGAPETDRNMIFYDYATNLKKMISNATAKQNELLKIINQIFISVEEENSKKRFIRINPDLTTDKLQSIIVDTRNIIVELYLRCEMDFTRGIQMYEAIIESRMFQTAQRQIQNLQKTAEMIIQRQTEY